MTQDNNSFDDIQDDQVELSSDTDAPEEQSPDSDEVEGNSEPKEIAQLREDLEKARDLSLRTQAEMQNVQRRANQDVEKAHKFGLEKFVQDILPVADNLERALSTSKEQEGDFTAIVEGVELTLKSLVDVLKKHNVEQIDPEGEPFDPAFHQAMTAIENPDMEPNTVVDVFQRGYTLHGRLVRPAMVVVSKAPVGE